MDKIMCKIEVWNTGEDFHIALCDETGAVLDASATVTQENIRPLVADMLRTFFAYDMPIPYVPTYAPPF